MAKIEINKRALQELADQAQAVMEEAITSVVKSHSGRPVDEVERALRAELKRRGITPGKDVRKIAQTISESDGEEDA